MVNGRLYNGAFEAAGRWLVSVINLELWKKAFCLFAADGVETIFRYVKCLRIYPENIDSFFKGPI